MVLNIILLLVGFVILIKGADCFVDGASSIAGHFKISKMLIGLTLVAFGTSNRTSDCYIWWYWSNFV